MRRLDVLKDDRGAAATVFVLFLGSGILLVLFAMTADAGAVFNERRVTQISADSASLSVASYCALGSPECGDGINLRAKAQEFANLNSNDKISDLQNLCGFTPLAPCSNESEVSCKPVPSSLQRYARAVVSTKNQDGTTKIKSPFLDAILGASTSTPTSKACSQAAWGRANSASISIPIAVSICDYAADGYKILREYSLQLPKCPTIIRDAQGLTITPQPQNVINGWAVASKTEKVLCSQASKMTIREPLGTFPPGGEGCDDLSGRESKEFLVSFIASNIGNKLFVPVIASTTGAGSGGAQKVYTNDGRLVEQPIGLVGFFSFIFLGYDFGPRGKGGCGGTRAVENNVIVFGYSCAEFVGQECEFKGTPTREDCIWGKFTKGIVPGIPVSRDNSFPPVGAQAIELLQ